MERKLAGATAAVSLALVTLFLFPASFFVPLTFVATIVMMGAALWVRGVPKLTPPAARSLAIGVVSALGLYAIFYGGNAAVAIAGIPGLGASSEKSIYALISNQSNPLSLQALLLLFDAVGYEAFFRGTLMGNLTPRWGVASAPLVALADAGLHLATFNPLWVATTFVADLVWGLTYHYGRGTQASLTSHFLWDLAVFVIRPIT